MGIIRIMIEAFILPVLSVGLGVFMGIKIRRVLAAPLVTLLIFSLYENIFYSTFEMGGKHINFIVISLVLCLVFKRLIVTEE